jgi:monovalent cation/hydrogen antiporter
VLITGVLILSRTLAALGAVIVTKIASHFITVADVRPGWEAPFILGWTGMRGVVSLAAALSIPVTLDNEMPFPHRNLILYVTFVVILLTLVLQGLTLPMIIGKIKLPHFNDHIPEEEAKALIRKKLADAALGCLEGKYKPEYEGSQILKHLADKWGLYLEPGQNRDIPDDIKAIYTIILEKQRKTLLSLNNKEQRIDEEVVRRFMHQIDLEEEKLKG